MVMIPPGIETTPPDPTEPPPSSPARAAVNALKDAGIIDDAESCAAAVAVVAKALQTHGVVDCEAHDPADAFRCELWGCAAKAPEASGYIEGQILTPGARMLGSGSPVDRVVVLGSIAHLANVVAVHGCGLPANEAAGWFNRALAACEQQRREAEPPKPKVVMPGALPPDVLARIRGNGKGGG